MNHPKIGIVTVLYYSASVLDGFFESLEKQTYKNFVLYAINNNSPDDSIKILRDYASHSSFPIVIIDEKENWGVAKGNNLGIEAALADGCEYVLLANNDTEFHADAIETLYNSLKDKGCDMIVPKIYFYGTDKIWCAGGRFGLRKVTYHYGAHKHDRGQFEQARIVKYAPTCFMLINAKVFEDVGRMNEKYFVYYDDTDFVWRSVVINGKIMYYEPKSVVYHKVSTSTSSLPSTFTLYHNYRNCAYFMSKYFSPWRRNFTYTYRMVRYLLSMIKRPGRTGFPTILGYYREGRKMYFDEIAENKN